MRIVPATFDDISDLEVLVQSCYRGDSSRRGWTHEADLLDGTRVTPDLLREDLSKPGVTILKCENNEGKMIGCVYTEIEHDKMHVGMLCVQPDLQCAGLGKQLLSAVDKLAVEKGCCAAKMCVISRRKELIEYYERRGYRNTGQKEPFPTGEAFGKPKVPLEFVVIQKDY